MKEVTYIGLLFAAISLAGCGGGGEGAGGARGGSQVVLPFLNPIPSAVGGDAVVGLDDELRRLIAADNLTGDPTVGLTIPAIDSPLAQLGMQLFYSKSLGGDMDTACVSCHHPMLGGGDNLNLGVGVHALSPDTLGPGRQHVAGRATVPRNAPTTFNTVLYRRSLFWDSRVALLDGGIRTPDSSYRTPDPSAGDTLLQAQARFPVTSTEEMRAGDFERDGSNQTVRKHLAARLGAFDGGFGAQSELENSRWEQEFQLAFGSSESADLLINYDNIARALASYQASQVFINNPWRRYIAGDTTAISDNAKRGALLFFTAKENNGADCSRCHLGDHFTDESHHVVAFPQIGPGKGDGNTGDDDFGLARETGDLWDQYKFRTPSLLNVEMTAPYGHAGAYQTLREVVSHYSQPDTAVRFFDRNTSCDDSNAGRGPSCATLFPNGRSNTLGAQRALANQSPEESLDGIDLNDRQIDQIVDFLETLTDPCTRSRECLTPWIPSISGGPDGHQLNAVDQFGNRL